MGRNRKYPDGTEGMSISIDPNLKEDIQEIADRFYDGNRSECVIRMLRACIVLFKDVEQPTIPPTQMVFKIKEESQ